MIVVIADDITGAAEICGIGLRYGLKISLSANADINEKVDLLVIYTNTRSLPEEEAVKVMHELTVKVSGLKPSLFYKKTDSVLRGHVLPEMKAQMNALHLTKALLMPANPFLGRTVRNGNYYVNGKPVHEAGFANDPEFPIRSSRIEDMLRASSNEMHILAVNSELPEGISIGQATSMKEVQGWALSTSDPVFYAGAASFFAALLGQRFLLKKNNANTELNKPVLLLSGTNYQRSIDKQLAYVDVISKMPEKLFVHDDVDEKLVTAWAEEVVDLLNKRSKCIMTVGKQKTLQPDPAILRRKMSVVAKLVFKKTKIKELLIEGGSTTFAVMQELGFTAFTPTEELQQGIVRMKVAGIDGFHFTIKPGSYAWPQEWEEAFIL